MYKMFHLLLPLLAVCNLHLGSKPADAHPFHISTAEMEYNPQTHRLQVSLKLHAVDLEASVSQLAKQKIDIDSDGSDRWITAYLSKHFYLQASHPSDATAKTSATEASPSSKIHMVGRELETSWLWLHFEMELPKQEITALANQPNDPVWRLHNSVLFETTPGQINTVQIRYASKRVALRMTPQAPSAKFDSVWLTAPLAGKATGE